jgi:Ca2+-transporting ATPase
MKPARKPAEHDPHEMAWALSVEQTLAGFTVDPQRGLEAKEITRRRTRFGPNKLQAVKRRSLVAIIYDQFRNVVTLLLVAAGVLAILFSDHIEGLAIFCVILVNGTIGFFTEWRALRSMEALSRLGHVDTLVLRAGTVTKISADGLVPGDIVLLEGGDVVTADMRLIESAKLQVDESTLTGESLPVSKHTDPLPAETSVMDRSNMVFKGTAITCGSGRAVVVCTGYDTELGRISRMVTRAEAHQTPLEKKLDLLGRRLAWVVIALAVLIALAGILVGRDMFLAIEIAVALAVAAIPEGLPIVATIALARGMWRMAQRNAVIARLSAVETLGATGIILTDKTGTLTENRMAVTSVWVHGQETVLTGSGRIADDSDRLISDAMQAAALCANASVRRLEDGTLEGMGDPTEVALLMAARERGLKRDALLEQRPEIAEHPFDPGLKLMATLHRAEDTVLCVVKGAPEAVIPRAISVRTATGDERLSDAERQTWLDQAHRFGLRGLRTITVAEKRCLSDTEDPYESLALLAIFGLEDPPRAGIRQAVERCREAGVSVLMVTGDHAATARNIASETGIFDVAHGDPACIDGVDIDRLLSGPDKGALSGAVVFSRVTPEQKLALIGHYQQAGNVVAMTGDGVNDAPALKKADIGVAMGIRGTAVAREAAAMVLRDDEFGTIVEAIAQGRAIYENIRKFAVYLFSCNISEVLVVSLATIAGAPLPLLPLQILFLNLVTDVFPALALGVGEGSPELMKKPPRKADEPLLTRMHWWRIGLHGCVISISVLAAMSLAIFWLDLDTEWAMTISFCTLALAQLWHVFNMRDNISRLFDNEITRNIWIWLALILCLGLVLAALYSPLLSGVLKLRDPGLEGWLVIVPLSLLPLLMAPVVRRISKHLAA